MAYVDPDIYDPEKPEAWYMLGVYCSDGCVYATKGTRTGYTTSLTSADKDWLSSIQKRFFQKSRLHEDKRGNGSYAIKVTHQNFVRWLLNNRCVPRKSLTFQMPNVPDKFLPDFFRGIVDGDGHVQLKFRRHNKLVHGHVRTYAYTYARVRITSGSELFVDQTVALFNKIGKWKTLKETRVSKPTPKSLVRIAGLKSYNVTINSNQAVKFLKWLYPLGFNDKICLRRKYEIAKQAFLLGK